MYFDSIEICQMTIDAFTFTNAAPMIIRWYFEGEHGHPSEKVGELMTAMKSAMVETAKIIKQKLENDELAPGEESEATGDKIMYAKWDVILGKTAV